MSPLTELYSSATDVKEGMFQAHSPDLGEESSSFLLLDSKKDLDTESSNKMAWSEWIFLCPATCPAEVVAAESTSTV